MKKIIRDFLLKDAWFYILTLIAISLIIASFVVPPLGVIDPSVLAATGELFAFASLGTVIKAIDNGTKATVKHKDTELTVGKHTEEDDTDNNNDITIE